MNTIKIYAKSIAIPVLVGGIVGIIISPFLDYATIEKPPFSPPSIVFPIVWTILYILMGVSYGMLQSKQLANADVQKIYYTQLVLNALWSIFFFVTKWRLFAFFWILLLALFVILMTIQFYRQHKIAGLLQIPYMVWVIFAAYLNLGVYLENL